MHQVQALEKGNEDPGKGTVQKPRQTMVGRVGRAAPWGTVSKHSMQGGWMQMDAELESGL